MASVRTFAMRAAAAAFAIGCATSNAGAQAPSVVGDWLGPVGEFIFQADGRAFARQLSGGTTFTSFGRYAVNGDVPSAQFSSVIPPRQCDFRGECIPAMPVRPFSFRFRFLSADEFVIGFDLPGPTDFRRIR